MSLSAGGAEAVMIFAQRDRSSYKVLSAWHGKPALLQGAPGNEESAPATADSAYFKALL